MGPLSNKIIIFNYLGQFGNNRPASRNKVKKNIHKALDKMTHRVIFIVDTTSKYTNNERPMQIFSGGI
jgi:hypothetical protein